MAKLTDSLIEFWKLDEASGTRNGSLAAFNLADTGATGTSVFNPLNDTTTQGAKCALFTGTTALNVVDNAALRISPTKGLTLSCWARLDSFSSDQFCVAGKGTGTDGFEYNITYAGFGSIPGYYTQQFGLAAQYYAYSLPTYTGYDLFSTPSILALGKWNHLVVVFAPPGVASVPTIAFYNNNILLGTAPCSNTSQIAGTVSRFAVGARMTNAGATSKNFIGAVANVGLWGRALAPSEVGDLYNNGYGRTYPFPGLVGVS